MNARRVLNGVSLLSAMMLVLTIALWAGAFVLDVSRHHLSITDSFHVGLTRGPGFSPVGRIAFFSEDEGPYQGSIICLSDETGRSSRPIDQVKFGDACGVYYRCFHFLDTGETLWTLTVSVLYPLAAFTALPIAWVCHGRRRSGPRGSVGHANPPQPQGGSPPNSPDSMNVVK